MAEIHIEHGRKLYYNLVNLKEAFDRVWHEGLCKVTSNFNIDENTIIIENPYKNTNSAILVNKKIGTFFNVPVGVRQGCLL